MRILKKGKEVAAFFAKLRARSTGEDQAIDEVVGKILADVSLHGDAAVLKYTRKFDDRQAGTIRISAAEIRRSADKADPGVVRALAFSAKRIRKFHEMQAEHSWTVTEGDTILGQSIRPLKRVGIYVPGGKAAYPSTVLMNVIPAQVAGVQEIAVCVPTPAGQVNPYVMAAIRMLGITEVYRVGGAQAVAAMAYGTKTVRQVDKIVGPGNIYVAIAKKKVFGLVDIDMIAGPSEILIIADDSANPSFIAADFLSQAEHDEHASPVLITNSKGLASRVSAEVARQLSRLKRSKIAQASIDNYGAIIVARSLADAVRLSNHIAPEHLEIMTEKPMDILPLVENAGAVFLGPWTPEALGDYAAGPNHTLPTGGTARFFSPLGVYDFYKRSSLIGFTQKGFARIAKAVESIAAMEGLEAHANSIRIRRARIPKT